VIWAHPDWRGNNIRFWHLADITAALIHVCVLGVKRTLPEPASMSAFDQSGHDTAQAFCGANGPLRRILWAAKSCFDDPTRNPNGGQPCDDAILSQGLLDWRLYGHSPPLRRPTECGASVF
jgi:hypothetical protein